MKKQHRSQIVASIAMAILAPCFLVGCGGNSSAADVDSEALLERYEMQGRRHDPEKFVETDLGTYMITRSIEGRSEILMVRCHLFAVSARDEAEELSEVLSEREKRMRDSVIRVLQKTDIEHLSEPTMNWMKSELIPALNKVLQTRALRDVVFSEFSLERA